MTVSIESPLTIALSKGRIFKDTLPLLTQAGIELDWQVVPLPELD